MKAYANDRIEMVIYVGVSRMKFLLFEMLAVKNLPELSGKLMLAKNSVEYEDSSASFYEIKMVKHFGPMHYLDL